MSDENDNDSQKNPLKYGVLNPISDPNKDRNFPTADSDGPIGNFSRTSETVRKNLYEGEISVDGEYNGVVLARSKPSSKNPDTSTSYGFMYSWLTEFGGDGKAYDKYYVRVPEIHAMNPIPKSTKHTEAIKMHHQFVDHRADNEKAQLDAGHVVVVSFYNSEGTWMPRIIERIGSYGGIYKEDINPKVESKVKGKKSDASGINSGYNSKNVSNAAPRGAGAKGLVKGIHTKKLPSGSHPGEIGSIRESDATRHEQRVRQPIFGSMRANSPNLITLSDVYSYKTKEKLHILAAKRAILMFSEARKEGYHFTVGSGWRPQEYNNYQEYRNHGRRLVKQEEYADFDEFTEFNAFRSPHETGLAMDIVSLNDEGNVGTKNKNQPDLHAIRPVSDTEEEQRHTDEYKWLATNAYKWGFTPFASEPWHWELLVPISNWASGREYINRSKGEDFSWHVLEWPKDSDISFEEADLVMRKPEINSTVDNGWPKNPKNFEDLKIRYPILKTLAEASEPNIGTYGTTKI